MPCLVKPSQNKQSATLAIMSGFLLDNTVNKASCTCLISGTAKSGRNYALSLLEFIFWSLLERHSSYEKIVILGCASSTKPLYQLIALIAVDEIVRSEIDRKLLLFSSCTDFEAYLTEMDNQIVASNHAIIISSLSDLILQEDNPLFIHKAMHSIFMRFRENENTRKLHLFATFYSTLHSKAMFESVAALFPTVVQIRPADSSGAGWTAAAEENTVAAEAQTVRYSHGRIHEKIELFRWGFPSPPSSGLSFIASPVGGTFLIPLVLPSSIIDETHPSKKAAGSNLAYDDKAGGGVVCKSGSSRLIIFDKGDPEFDEDDDPDADLDL